LAKPANSTTVAKAKKHITIVFFILLISFTSFELPMNPVARLPEESTRFASGFRHFGFAISSSRVSLYFGDDSP
jgi:hypothetical protein